MTRENPTPGRLTRRSFLKTAGMATGAVAFPSVVSGVAASGAEAAPRTKKKRRKVAPPLEMALLIPSSGLYPSLGRDLLSGMSLRFEEFHASGGRAVRATVSDIGVGEGRATRTAEELLDEGMDFAVGFASSRVSAILAGTFEDRDTAFIALDSGADVARRDEESPEFSNSLFLWRSERAFGEWAAGNLGKRAVMAASAYDSSFDARHAFRLGFEGAGGAVLDEFITHRPGGGPDLPETLSGIKNSAPDFVHAAYCGSHAVEFVAEYAKAGTKNIPLLGSAFLTDESILGEQGAAALGVKTCLSWSPGLTGAANRHFVSAYRKKTKRTPGALAALGYETAAVISAAIKASGGDLRLNTRFGDALSSVRPDGPRGRAKTNLDGAEFPLYIREARRTGKTLANATVSKTNSTVPESQLAELRDSMKTGWLNTYLSL